MANKKLTLVHQNNPLYTISYDEYEKLVAAGSPEALNFVCAARQAHFETPGPVRDPSASYIYAPTPYQLASDRVQRMSLMQRFETVIEKTKIHLPEQYQTQWDQLLSGSNLALIAGVFVVWAGSHAFGAGQVADAMLILIAAIAGINVIVLVSKISSVINLTVHAKEPRHLDSAALTLAELIAEIGIDLFLMIVTWGVGKSAKRLGAMLRREENMLKIETKQRTIDVPNNPRWILTTGYIRDAGMTPRHFQAAQDTAAETGLLIGIRRNSEKVIDLIQNHKCPPKDKDLENIASSGEDALMTVKDDVLDAVNLIRGRYPNIKSPPRGRYAVVDSDLKARYLDDAGNLAELPLKHKFWTPAKGQVIDVATGKPIVGDYDLQGVIRLSNMGQNIRLVASHGETLADFRSPDVNKVIQLFNQKMGGLQDVARMLHGAQDQYGGFRSGATFFFPDGKVLHLPSAADVEKFYQAIKRQTASGSY